MGTQLDLHSPQPSSTTPKNINNQISKLTSLIKKKGRKRPEIRSKKGKKMKRKRMKERERKSERE